MENKEILEKSQEENKGKDSRENGIVSFGYQVGALIGGLFAIALYIVERVMYDRSNYGYIAIVFIIAGTVMTIKAIKLKRTHEIVFAICELALAVSFIALTIVNLINGK